MKNLSRAFILANAVQIQRSTGSGTTLGVVLWKNRRLLVLANITDEYRANGFSLIRLRDVTSMVPLPHDKRLQTALRKFGLRVKPLPSALTATESMAAFALKVPAHYPVALHQEHHFPNECEVGFIVKTDKRSLTMDCLSLNGESTGRHAIPCSRITRIDLLGRYETIVCHAAETLQRRI